MPTLTNRPIVDVSMAVIKTAMGLREVGSCANCARLAKHPDSGRGGEMHERFQCTANALFKFEVLHNEVQKLTCDHYDAARKPVY